MLRYILHIILICLFISPTVGFTADSTSFNPVPISVVAKGAGGVPVGTIIAWPVAQNPADMEINWLECNGQSISASAYPELFAIVGARVPDFRGLFLRGVGGNSAVLGVAQNFATASTIQIATAYVDLGGGGWDGWAYAPYPQAGGGWTTLSGDIETRPVNKAVRYFIKALP